MTHFATPLNKKGAFSLFVLLKCGSYAIFSHARNHEECNERQGQSSLALSYIILTYFKVFVCSIILYSLWDSSVHCRICYHNKKKQRVIGMNWSFVMRGGIFHMMWS